MTQPLKPVHPEESLIPSKLEGFAKASNDWLIESLQPGKVDSLKARPDGTLLDGYHRIKILRDRGVPVDELPRDIVIREDLP